jgi:O-antigen/teichoic acid export membrane protein
MGIVQRDSFRITIIAYIGAAIGYLNKIFLFTNFLETDQVGLANLIITLTLIYAQFAALGSYNITYKFFPFFNDRKNHHHGFLFGVSVLALAGFIISTLLFLALQKPFKLFYQESSPLLVEYFYYLIPLAFTTLFYHLFDSYLRSLYRNIVPSLIYEVALRIFVTLAISIYALGWISFPTFVLIYVIANCLPAVFIIIYTWYINHLLLNPWFSPLWRRVAKIILVYGIFSLFNNLSVLLLSSIDSLMVAQIIDLSAAGIYTTMIFITSVLLIPYRSIVKVSSPVVAEHWKARSMDKMEKLYHSASDSNLVIGGGLFLLLWVNIDSIFLFMPDEYAAGKMVFLLLSIGRLFDMTAGLNGVILLTSKKYRYDLFFTIGLVVFAIISNYFFIPIFGMNGAAFASMITIILYNILRIIFIQVHFRIQPFLWKQLWVPFIVIVASLISAAFGEIINVYFDVLIRSTVIGLLFIIPVYYLRISVEINNMTDGYLKLFMRWVSKNNR